MQLEIEVKFLNIDFDDMRARLKSIDAQLEEPMRLMRRVLIQTPRMKAEGNDAFIRIRDEGNAVTVTFKEFKNKTLSGTEETEIVVSDYDKAIAIFAAGGLKGQSYQESRRETWSVGDVEVVLDERPWLNPYIEIEGPSEESVKAVAEKLKFDWNDAVFGSVGEIFKRQYPDGRRPDGVIDVPIVKFGEPLPDKFKPLPKNER